MKQAEGQTWHKEPQFANPWTYTNDSAKIFVFPMEIERYFINGVIFSKD